MVSNPIKKFSFYLFLPVTVLLVCLFLLSAKQSEAIIPKPDKGFEILRSYRLPDILNETSGIVYFNQLIWSFNDSGGEPELYAWSEADSSLVKRVTLWNAYNFDWEDIAQDSLYLYVGDIGNNFGNRNNLCIYRIKKSNLLKDSNQAVKAEKIFYTYPGYKASSYLSFNLSSYDCEAMVVAKDSLYLFTKDWNNGITKVFSIHSKPGKFLATEICTINVDGLITAADYNGRSLVLLGYKDFAPFLWIFRDIKGFNLTDSVGKKYILNGLDNAQTEGVCFKNDSVVYISNEKSSIDQRLWVVGLK